MDHRRASRPGRGRRRRVLDHGRDDRAVFPKQELGRAFGIFGLVATLALGFGPFVGGFLTELISRRVIFFINLPLVVAVLAIILAAWREPEQAGPRPRFDAWGQLALLALLLPLVPALRQGPDWGWDSPAVIALLAVAVLATPVFFLVERRAREPLIDLEVLARPTVAGCNVVVAGAQFTKIAVIVFGALYFQERLEMTPLGAGAALLTAMALTPITGSLAGSLIERYGNRLTTLVGVAVGGVGLAWLGLFMPEDEFLILVPGLLAWGASLQFFFSGPEAAVMAAVPPDEQGQAGGVLTGTQMLGGSLAVAVLGAFEVGANPDHAAMFWVSAAVSAAIWVAAHLLIDRPPRGRDSAGARAEGATSSAS